MSERTIENTCWKFCNHGGQCELLVPHDGMDHSAGACTFTDEEAVSQAEADAILRTKSGGATFLDEEVPLLEALGGVRYREPVPGDIVEEEEEDDGY